MACLARACTLLLSIYYLPLPLQAAEGKKGKKGKKKRGGKAAEEEEEEEGEEQRSAAEASAAGQATAATAGKPGGSGKSSKNGGGKSGGGDKGGGGDSAAVKAAAQQLLDSLESLAPEVRQVCCLQAWRLDSERTSHLLWLSARMMGAVELAPVAACIMCTVHSMLRLSQLMLFWTDLACRAELEYENSLAAQSDSAALTQLSLLPTAGLSWSMRLPWSGGGRSLRRSGSGRSRRCCGEGQ